MSLRPLVEGDCGAVNPLMQLGGQFSRDVAHKDEGFAQAQFERSLRPDEQLVADYLGHVAAPPQSFQMNTLLQEMRDININGTAPQRGQQEQLAGQWSRDFVQQQLPNKMLHLQPQQQQMQHAQEFFDEPLISSQNFMPPMMMRSPYMAITAAPAQQQQQQDDFFDEQMETIRTDELPQLVNARTSVEDWISDYQREKEHSEQTATNFNEKFWQRLQDEWQKLAEENEHPWLSEYNENLDAYKEYEFAEQNPMSELDNAFEKGKEYLSKGDIPSAVLCFEVAAKKEPERAEIWQLLGISQAENEMDPQGIAALKRALDLQPENRQVLMALAVCYTNESLQSNAVKMLSNWLEVHPQYKHLLSAYPQLQSEGATSSSSMASSLIGANKLRELQQVYLEAVRLQPAQVDSDLQEALGVLYNLSGEYDKAVDCYRSAVQVDPQNAKLWNRLGASLANGSRSVEAVEAYQQALQLQPGFIRVRYNVGVCCMNLKAYKEGAEHLLTALTMQAHTNAARELPSAQAMGQNQMSESIWSTLKMVISLMGRSDLQGHVSDRNLQALNEAFKD
ncbi:peroxisomal targeting signal 1 receptor [Drosophila innubila]|uniref:peroxisomal targeting signal 1 receptor n=1 Tax=Drosophila innubila TaxID=198719 RepID=UPI00148CA848|nr:peroxisomal targeting signal 1 receptor [Drosophila innubila]